MRSPEKVLRFLEEIQSYPDEDIVEAVPLGIPAPALRGALVGVAAALPDDAADLDGLLDRLGSFCLSLRSDDAPAPTGLPAPEPEASA